MKDLYKILSGKIYLRVGSVDIFVSGPTVEDRYKAEVFADQVYNQSFMDGCYTQEEMEDLLKKQGSWSEKKEEELSTLPALLEKMKLDYYTNFFNEKSRLNIKSHIDSVQDKFKRLTEKKYLYFEHTCEGMRLSSLHDFLIRRTTFFKNGTAFDFGSVSPRVVSIGVARETLSADEVRQISKSEEWRSMWSCSRNPESFFENIADMTTMQTALITWSKLYDSVYESVETPSQEVIDDDLALDGWMIHQRKKREDEQKKSRGEKMSEKMKNAGEIMIPANTVEDIKRVYGMNTQEGLNKTKSRFRDLSERGTLEEQNFKMVRRDVAMKANMLSAAANRRR